MTLVMHVVDMSMNLLTLITPIYATSSLTNEAEGTALIISKIMNESVFNEDQKIDFMFFITQVRARNLNVQNMFFKINWNVLLTVSRVMDYQK